MAEGSAADDLDPRAARLLHMLDAGGTAGAGLQSPHDRRESLRALADVAADPPPPQVRCEALICPASNGGSLQVRRYTSADAVAGAAMLYLHGGGWVAGDLDTHAGVCGALALASGCSVFALHYRRPPEHPFPGPLEDALDALDWLHREAGPLGIDSGRLILAGDSAGANLAAAAAQDGRAPRLALLLLLCPILDLPRDSGSRARFGQGFFLSAARLAGDAGDYLQGARLDDPRVSPLLALAPPRAAVALIHAAACDPFRDEAVDYAARLRDAGLRTEVTIHPGMIHYFYALPRAIPYARAALAAIGAQVKAELRRG